MPTPPSRGIRIDPDERGAWSSDRPRRAGGASRPPDVSVRCRVLPPADRLRWSPGSLLVVVSADPAEREEFAERLVRPRAAVLGREKVRALLADRVSDDELEERTDELLRTAVLKRLESGETTVLLAGLEPEEREEAVLAAARLRRPRHLLLLEGSQEAVPDEERPALNALRRRLDAGELGEEGFQTAMRLGGAAVGEVKALTFASAPREP